LSDSGRDSTAFSVNDCTAFVMDIKILNIIKNNYNEIYQEMAKLGVFRHKKHQIKISKCVREHHKLDNGELDQISDISDESS
jgi:hypothetical protein